MKKIAKVLVGLFVIMVLLSMCSAWGDDDESSEEQTTKVVQETKKTAKKNGIAVALLKQPVIWDGFEVNIVLMFALHKSFDQVPKLYDLILNVFDDPVRFAQVLECDSYAAFMKKIHIT
ncbi:MAG: PTS sugar transporter subunit IIA [Eubacterium sp.]|nr:PTS sugar transporter subunit IIA [Eubacterium sp.]